LCEGTASHRRNPMLPPYLKRALRKDLLQRRSNTSRIAPVGSILLARSRRRNSGPEKDCSGRWSTAGRNAGQKARDNKRSDERERPRVLTFSTFPVVAVHLHCNANSWFQGVVNQHRMFQTYVREAPTTFSAGTSARWFVQGDAFSKGALLMLTHVMRRIQGIEQTGKLQVWMLRENPAPKVLRRLDELQDTCKKRVWIPLGASGCSWSEDVNCNKGSFGESAEKRRLNALTM